MALLRLTSEGRGTHYSAVRGLIESSLRVAYRGDWPAALWGALPRSRRVRCVRHTLALFPGGAPPLRVGFVSDIHIGPTTPRALLEAAFDRLANEALDVLLLGGDYVFLDATEEKGALLASLVARVPAPRKFAVLGNHDLWTRHEVIEDALVRAGVKILSNRAALVESTNGAVAIIGLDDPWTGSMDVARALVGVGEPHTVVVLCHSPEGLAVASEGVRNLPGAPRGLFVCGHTHGGHIATPWGPVIVPGELGRKYPHGLHDVPPLLLHVSRGVGGIELPMRTYAVPEVAVFDLVPS